MPGLFAHRSASDYKQAEQNLARELEQRAINQIEGVNSPDDMHLRDILPSEDLEPGADQSGDGWVSAVDDHRVWLQGDMSQADLMHAYNINASGRAEGKVIGVYAISAQADDPATTEVEFRDGTGSIYERVAFQEAHHRGTDVVPVQALMRNPVIFNEGHDGEIHQFSDDESTTQAAGNAADFRGDELAYHGFVAEKAGTTLGTRSQTESTPSGVSRQTI